MPGELQAERLQAQYFMDTMIRERESNRLPFLVGAILRRLSETATPMHALPILKQACLEALETDGEPGDPGRFFSIVDPGSVLELVEIAETSITGEEVEALHQVITELTDFIRRTAPTPEAMKLLLRARMVVGVTTR